jgi:hypothetical protein
MLDSRWAHITEFRHRYRDETDVIMTKIRDMTAAGRRAGVFLGRRAWPSAGGGVAGPPGRGAGRRRRGRRAGAGRLY